MIPSDRASSSRKGEHLAANSVAPQRFVYRHAPNACLGWRVQNEPTRPNHHAVLESDGVNGGGIQFVHLQFGRNALLIYEDAGAEDVDGLHLLRSFQPFDHKRHTGDYSKSNPAAGEVSF